jgi:capsular polysaccharide biosynthesis protein
LNFITNKSNVGWPHPKDISILREHFKTFFKETIPGRKVYISRIGESRSPLFEKDLITLLEEKGWIILNASKMSLQDQISEISSAQFLAGIHGAGLSGVNWLDSRDAQLIEIGDDRFVRCFQRLSNINKVKYTRINYKNDLRGLDIIRDEFKLLNLI